jgi:hypothetical protein
LEFSTTEWQRPLQVLNKIQSKYDGKILSASGSIHLSTIHAMVTSDRKNLYPIFEDKVEITTNSETREEKTQTWFRLKSEDGPFVLESSCITFFDTTNLTVA